MRTIDLSTQRQCFPALTQVDAEGQPYISLDNPGGTQASKSVISAMTDYLIRCNATAQGAFITSKQSDQLVWKCREAMTGFFNASRPEEIIFGANMTPLTFNVIRAFGRMLSTGDEVILTRLEYDANISPWLAFKENGIAVKFLDLKEEDCTLNLEPLTDLLSPRRRLIAIGYVSNAVGTINPLKTIIEQACRLGALVYVDAIHYAPYAPTDVVALDCDFLVGSAHKIFGPQLGIIYGKYDLLRKLKPYKVPPANEHPPHKLETGTPNFEGIIGCDTAINHLADTGQRHQDKFRGELLNFGGRRRLLKIAMHAIQLYERSLVETLIAELKKLPGITIYGIIEPERFAELVPTVSIRHRHLTPRQIAKFLSGKRIFVWIGNFYALELTKRPGIEEHGGLLRIGLAHFNTRTEIAQLIKTLEQLFSQRQIVCAN